MSMTKLCRGRKPKCTKIDIIVQTGEYVESQSEPGRLTEKREYNREREWSREEKRICDWVSSTLLQTVHCFFIPPDIKAPSFLLWERKCYGAMAQFVTHIIWISAPLYFHKSCHARKTAERQTERERDCVGRQKEKQRGRRGIKRKGVAGAEGGGYDMRSV